jgi:hypothetical protein
MSLSIKLRSPEVSEEYTEWVNKSTAFDREYYNYNAPDQYRELYRVDIPGRYWTVAQENNVGQLWEVFTSPILMLTYLLERTPFINPEEETLIDFCCGLIAACIKFPDATIKTY